MKYLIVGAGAVGLALADELHRLQAETVLLNRSGTAPEKLPESARLQKLDAVDSHALAQAARGCAAIVHAAGDNGPNRETALPALMESCIAASEESGLPLVYVDTLDAYGDNAGIPMSEATPERPASPQELLRARVARQLTQAGNARRLRHCIARAGDLFGPRVTGYPLGLNLFEPLIRGQAARLLGRLDMPHSFTFVRDLARSVAKLLDDDRAWGQTWHLPSPQPITQQQVLDIIRDMGTRQVSGKTLGSGMIGLKKAFNAELRAVEPILYRYEKPYVINHSRFSTTFGERVTAHEQALFETLEWFKRQAGIERRYGY